TALESLLDWIETHPLDDSLDGDVEAALALSNLLVDQAPDQVARVFRVLDKRLKRRGDLKLVYITANQSIEAAKKAKRSEATAIAEAIALICGRSWVYQRVGELERADADAQQSLEIGEHLGDERTVAYCHKCIGRLRRMQAEESREARQRELLESSVEHLNHAIDAFTKLRYPEEAGD